MAHGSWLEDWELPTGMLCRSSQEKERRGISGNNCAELLGHLELVAGMVEEGHSEVKWRGSGEVLARVVRLEALSFILRLPSVGGVGSL